MQGMSRQNGLYLDDINHLKQSIVDILSTPIGSRVLNRDYGSNLYKLIDEPVNTYLYQKIYAAVVEALDRWEPRIKVTKLSILSVLEGKITLKIYADYLIKQEKISIDGVVV